MQEQAPIHYQQAGYKALRDFIKGFKPSKTVVLLDDNTDQLCLEYFLEALAFEQMPIKIAIPPGEEQKHMGTCMALIVELTNQGLDRKSLIINLGGGVLTDLGGFVASIYKRGIAFVNVPTTLLSMVDAAVGGKTGVDLEHIKNQIGVINQSEMVLIDPEYLSTLPQREIHSGFAEMIKHGLISNQAHWQDVLDSVNTDKISIEDLIKDSIAVKHSIVTKDPFEQGIRKSLNYGHTLGHAIESYCLASEKMPTLLHGEAIAIGLVLETYISCEQLGCPKSVLEQLSDLVSLMYQQVRFSELDINEIIELMIYDKKNVSGQINFVLLENIGAAKLDCQVDNALIKSAFAYYQEEK